MLKKVEWVTINFYFRWNSRKNRWIEKLQNSPKQKWRGTEILSLNEGINKWN